MSYFLVAVAVLFVALAFFSGPDVSTTMVPG